MLDAIRKKLLFEDHLCTWWIAYTFDNPLRKIFHNPDKIFKGYIKKGMTVLDIGCGMGYFSIAMAKMTGTKGRVIAVDVQEKMLKVMSKRAAGKGVLKIITPNLASGNDLKLKTKADFALSFWMIHEVPDKKRFLKQVYNALKSKGRYLIVEPKLHTGEKYFKGLEDLCKSAGFKLLGKPSVALSRALLLTK
jgi:ubiquinone/menaquinone biosynthesis C-methylase UbiE